MPKRDDRPLNDPNEPVKPRAEDFEQAQERLAAEQEERKEFGHTGETAREDAEAALDFGPEDVPPAEHRESAVAGGAAPVAEVAYEDGAEIESRDDSNIHYIVTLNRSDKEEVHPPRGEGDTELVVPAGFYLAVRKPYAWGRPLTHSERTERPVRAALDPAVARDFYRVAVVAGRV